MLNTMIIRAFGGKEHAETIATHYICAVKSEIRSTRAWFEFTMYQLNLIYFPEGFSEGKLIQETQSNC